MLRFAKFLFLGIIFGIFLTKAEVLSWYRIQEMFRFQSFHMYGVITTAILTGMLSVQIIKRFHIRSLSGVPIDLPPKKYNHGILIGGFIFGLGWALTGACPGPLFALIGNGYWAAMVMLAFAILGTYLYGYFREKLPH